MKEISPSELAALGDAATIIDVREQVEYDQVHIDGSTLIPMSELLGRLAEVPKDETIYLLCATGNRSGNVAAYLEQEGYDAVNVAGGITAWQGIGQPVGRG